MIEPCTRFYAFRFKERHGEAVVFHVFPDTGSEPSRRAAREVSQAHKM